MHDMEVSDIMYFPRCLYFSTVPCGSGAFQMPTFPSSLVSSLSTCRWGGGGGGGGNLRNA